MREFRRNGNVFPWTTGLLCNKTLSTDILGFAERIYGIFKNIILHPTGIKQIYIRVRHYCIGPMKNIEVIIIGLLATGCSLLTWLILKNMSGGNGFFDSFATALIFPPIFVILFLLMRHIFKRIPR